MAPTAWLRAQTFIIVFRSGGTGLLKVQYTASGGRQEKIDGPELAERQEGRLVIVLLPGGKAEFHPELYTEG